MDPDRQPSPPSGSSPVISGATALMQEPEEEPDSPRATVTGGPPVLVFDDLLSPLLGPLIALLAVTVPLVTVLSDRRALPGSAASPAASPAVTPAVSLPALRHGSEPASPIAGTRRGESGGGDSGWQPQ